MAPSSASPDGSIPACRVSIHVHPTPVPVSYSTIRTLIPVILEEYAKTHGGRQPDIVVHMGIAATRNYYSVETQAHRDAYYLPDINGRSGFQDGEMHWRSLGLPPTLSAGRSTDIPATSATATTSPDSNPHPPDDRFLDVWRSFGPPEADLRVSRDAGRYACEFILYTSLALAFQKGENRSVAFLHVPGSCYDEDIELGRSVAIAFIKALVECWFDRKA